MFKSTWKQQLPVIGTQLSRITVPCRVKIWRKSSRIGVQNVNQSLIDVAMEPSMQSVQIHVSTHVQTRVMILMQVLFVAINASLVSSFVESSSTINETCF
jgi:hypothetical protein